MPDDGGRLPVVGDPDAVHVGTLVVLATVAFLLSPVFVSPPKWTFVLFEVAILFALYAMLVVGVNFQFGHAGLVNFGPVAFFAVGGYTAAMLAADDPYAGIGLGLPWPVAVGTAVLAAVALGGVLGVSTLRLRDDFLAIVTLAVAEIVHGLASTFQSITGGSIGLGGVPTPIADLTRSGGPTMLATLVLFAGVTLVSYGVFHRLADAPYGRVLHAIRADERVTETLGKHVFRYKLAAFVYGAALMGLAGSLYALYLGAVSPGFFTIDVTVLVWVGMLVGGAGADRGAIAGLAVVMSFQLATRFLNQEIPTISQSEFASIRLVLVGLLLIVIIRYRPEGIWGNPEELETDR